MAGATLVNVSNVGCAIRRPNEGIREDRHPHNHYDDPPSIAWKVTDTDVVTVSFASAIVVLRCYTKFCLAKSRDGMIAIDTCIIALCLAIGRTAVDFVGHCQYGAGPEYLNGYLTMAIFNLVAIVFAKLSLLIFLYRNFHVDKSFRIAAWATGTISVVGGIIAGLMAIFACRPFAAS